MDVISLDFESYYDPASGYTLSKMTTEAYIRDPRFESILCSMSVNGMRLPPLCGPDAICAGLEERRTLIERSAMVCHHAHFDGLILYHHYGIKPKVWFDTLSMAKALLSHKLRSLSLASLLEYFQIGEKGHEVEDAKGKHFEDFTSEQFARYISYCQNDEGKTYQLFLRLLPMFPPSELRVIDTVVRMFTEPKIAIRSDLLRLYVIELQSMKERLLRDAGIDLDTVMSNAKFAEALQKLDVEPPMKKSLTTGKMAFAFAKTDEAFQDLLNHDDDRVVALVEARLGNKSTINETRAIRMAEMGDRGLAAIYLHYSGAFQTHRLSGGDKMNWQNMSKPKKPKPSDIGRMVVTPRGVTNVLHVDLETCATPLGTYRLKDVHLFGLRDALEAPEGYELVVADSANIEARVLDTLAWQEDAVQRYRDKVDPYIHLASKIYDMEVTAEEHPDKRQLGKVGKLGLGYGMGHVKFVDTSKAWKVTIDPTFANHVVTVYRNTHHKVTALWRAAGEGLTAIAGGLPTLVDPKGLLRTAHHAVLLPNGLAVNYAGLDLTPDPDTGQLEWTYFDGRKRARIYGGKMVENFCQALARIIVGDQMVEMAKRHPVANFVHDEVWLLVKKGGGAEALAFALDVMRRSPAWWPELPLDADGSFGTNYGGCK